MRQLFESWQMMAKFLKSAIALQEETQILGDF